eukprot:766098-Hanusia_phi.AAC.1
MGTVAAQYIAVVPLLLKLHQKVRACQARLSRPHLILQFHLQFSLASLRNSLASYLSSGSFVFIRTIGKVLTYFVRRRVGERQVVDASWQVCSREAALLGTVSSAAYNIWS